MESRAMVPCPTIGFKTPRAAWFHSQVDNEPSDRVPFLSVNSQVAPTQHCPLRKNREAGLVCNSDYHLPIFAYWPIGCWMGNPLLIKQPVGKGHLFPTCLGFFVASQRQTGNASDPKLAFPNKNPTYPTVYLLHTLNFESGPGPILLEIPSWYPRRAPF
jgi:hypothetical protein